MERPQRSKFSFIITAEKKMEKPQRENVQEPSRVTRSQRKSVRGQTQPPKPKTPSGRRENGKLSASWEWYREPGKTRANGSKLDVSK